MFFIIEAKNNNKFLTFTYYNLFSDCFDYFYYYLEYYIYTKIKPNNLFIIIHFN